MSWINFGRSRSAKTGPKTQKQIEQAQYRKLQLARFEAEERRKQNSEKRSSSSAASKAAKITAEYAAENRRLKNLISALQEELRGYKNQAKNDAAYINRLRERL